MFDARPRTLVILPTNIPFDEEGNPPYMIYGDRNGPWFMYDMISLRASWAESGLDPRVGWFVFHPREGGLIWMGDPYTTITERCLLRHTTGRALAAIDHGVGGSFLLALARGVSCDRSHGRDLPRLPSGEYPTTWQQIFAAQLHRRV